MSDYINKIKKDETEYDIQDARVPEASASDEGKALVVNSEGGLEFSEVGGEESEINITSTTTFEDVRIGLNLEIPQNFGQFVYANCKADAFSSGPFKPNSLLAISLTKNADSYNMSIISISDIFNQAYVDNFNYTTIYQGTSTDIIANSVKGKTTLLSLTNLDSSKEYILEAKEVFGSIRPVWQEKQSSGGGTQLYNHSLRVSVPDNRIDFDFVSTSATEITVDNVTTEFTKNIYHFNAANDIVLRTYMNPNLSITSYQIQMAGNTLRIAVCVFGKSTSYAEVTSISDTVTAL